MYLSEPISIVLDRLAKWRFSDGALAKSTRQKVEREENADQNSDQWQSLHAVS